MNNMLNYVIDSFKDSDDIFFLDIKVGNINPVTVTLSYIDGLVNSELVDNFIIRELKSEAFTKNKKVTDIIPGILEGGLSHLNLKEVTSKEDFVAKLLNSFAVIYYDGRAVAFEIKGASRRVVSAVADENIVKGSREGFVENIRFNTALIRTYISNEKLCIKSIDAKLENKTSICLAYLSDKADSRVLKDLSENLSKLEGNNLLSSSLFEEHITGKKNSLFPQIMFSERVDKICANITEGKIAVIIDGNPSIYLFPTTFSMFMQAPEDYSNNYIAASATRLLRYVAMIVALILPAYYISATTFHQDMLPESLVISIIKSKEDVPFKIYLEVFFMLFAFEFLIEAGIRMPKSIGQAVSIVGALVVGEAAVSASFISPAVIVVVALAGISGFVIPNQNLSIAVRLWRLVLAALACICGLYGIVLGLIIMGVFLSSLEMFSIPYLWPFVFDDDNWLKKDTLLRLPMKARKSK